MFAAFVAPVMAIVCPTAKPSTIHEPWSRVSDEALALKTTCVAAVWPDAVPALSVALAGPTSAHALCVQLAVVAPVPVGVDWKRPMNWVLLIIAA